MGNTFDLFVAHFTCAACGVTSQADDSTNAQTYIRDLSERAWLTEGHPLVLDPERIASDDYDGYISLRAPEPGAPVYILTTWECPACGSPFEWAEVEVRRDVISRIESVRLDLEHVPRCNLISLDITFLLRVLTDQHYDEANRAEVRAMLQQIFA